jgi:hypothetical protein
LGDQLITDSYQPITLKDMAKKVVATLKSGKGKDFTKVIKMVKSEKTGAYAFREEIVHNDHIADFLKSK